MCRFTTFYFSGTPGKSATCLLHFPTPCQKPKDFASWTLGQLETVCASLGHSIWPFISTNPQISIFWVRPKPIAMNALFVPYKEPTLQPGNKNHMVCLHQETAVAGNVTCCCACHPCPHAMKTEKFTHSWTIYFAMPNGIDALMAAPRHGLCLVHVWTHRRAQSFKNEIDTNSHASPDSWGALGYAIYNSQVYHNPVTEPMGLNQTHVIQIKVNNNPQMGVTCHLWALCM